MKRFLSVSFLVVLSILIAPTFSENYSVLAGKTVAGNINSANCDCGTSVTECYDELTWQLCSGNPGGDGRQAVAPDDKSDKLGSLGMLVVFALLLLKRFI